MCLGHQIIGQVFGSNIIQANKLMHGKTSTIKSKQIGILKAMGVTDGTASLIFLVQGVILGILGAIGGVLLGLLLTFMFSTLALDPDENPVVPLLIDNQFIALSGLVAILSASVASIIPAIRSSKLSVIEVIKNG